MARHSNTPRPPTPNPWPVLIKCHYLSETADRTHMSLAKHCIVEPGSHLRLKHRDPNDTFGKKRDEKKHGKTLDRLRELQHLLYADKRYSLLIVLQALDAGGKDGTIRHVMSGVNPQGCDVIRSRRHRPRAVARLPVAHPQAVPPLGKSGFSTVPITKTC